MILILGSGSVNFRNTLINILNFQYFSEFSVIMPFEGFRLIAIFDFISLMETNKIMIRRLENDFAYAQKGDLSPERPIHPVSFSGV